MKKLILVSTEQKGNNVTFSTEEVEGNYRRGAAMLIPMYDNTPYLKGAVEATTNSLWQLTTALQPNKTCVPYEEIHTGKTDEEIHEELMIVIKSMTNLLQKMVHSTSYRNGTFHEFDAIEFEGKLIQLGAMCRRQFT